MLIARLKQRPTNKEFDPATEFKLSAPANYPLERVIDVERAMIMFSVSFPAGGSLLLVGKKPEAAQ